jgi:uncharacterized protein YndB with AHSA1/START domain
MAAQSDTDLVISRTFQAPRALVFQAWLDPKHLVAWWGPRGFTTRAETDPRVGGRYRLTMVSDTGEEYPMKGSYREIVPHERIVYDADLSEHPPSWHDLIDPARDRGKPRPALTTLTTVTFEDKAGATLMTVHTRFETKTLRDSFARNGMEAGFAQCFDRLDERLFSEREIMNTRVFTAPRELVWKVWTQPEHIARWWGPRGFTNTISKMEVKSGGSWEFVMHGPDGKDYVNKHVYVEIAAPERLVMDHVSGPVFRMTATFTEEGGKTRVIWRMRFESAELRDRVAREFGAVEGLSQNFDKLGEYLQMQL